MGVIKYQVSTSGFTEDFLIRVWEANGDGPGGHIYETTLVEKNSSGVATPGAGHQVIDTVTINGVDTVPHILRMYGVTSGTKYHEVTLEPKTDVLTVFAPIRFKIGDGGTYTPAADADSFTHPSLVGLTDDQYTIYRANYGPLLPDMHYTSNSGTGSFQLMAGNGSGETFNDEEEFTIQIMPQAVTTPVNDSVVGKEFGGFLDVVANVNYEASHLRKLRRFLGAFEYTFPLATTVPVGYGHCFQNFGLSGTAKVKFLNGTLLWAGSPKTSIDIPPYSEACFVWDGTNWNVKYFIDSSFANAGSTPANTVLGVGELNVGDVLGTNPDPLYTVTHNLGITGDYKVFLSVRSNNSATYWLNNKVGLAWHHHATDKPNKFYITAQELSIEVQDLSIVWICVKA